MKKSLILIMLFFFAISVYPASASKQWQKGKKAYDKKEYNEAVYSFKKAAEADHQNGDYFRWLGHAYYSNGQYQAAVDAYKQALIVPHEKVAEHESWDRLAESYEKLGQKDSMISFREKFIELQPNDFYNFIELSKLYVKNFRYDKAITVAKRAIELKSDYHEAYKNLGVAYGRNYQYNEAIRAYKKAIEIDSKPSADYIPIGLFLMEKNAYTEAAEVYKKFVEAKPSNPDFHIFLAEAYYHMGRIDEALVLVNRAIEIGNYEDAFKKNIYSEKRHSISRAFSFGLRSLIYRSKGDQDASYRDAEKAYPDYSYYNSYQILSSDKADKEAYDLGLVWDRIPFSAAYIEQGEYDKAIEHLSRLEGPMARLLEATAYAKHGKVKEAATVYISIPEEEISPKNIPLINERVALLQLFKPYVKEYRIKARTLEEKGLYKEALLALSEALKTADNTEAQAIRESIFSVTRMNPSFSGMLSEEARKHALRAEVMVKDGNFEQAAAEYTKAIWIAPWAARLYYNSALIQAQLKKYPGALRQMKLYLQAAPGAPDARAAKDEIIKWEFMIEKDGDN